MAADRRARIVARLVAEGGSPSAPGPLCKVAAEVIDVSGAGVMVLHDGVPQASLCSSGPTSALIEELQYTLGEGPCVDAYRTGSVILEPHLTAPAMLRWPAFTPEALAAGAMAVFGFPVRIGAVRIGALNVFQDRPGPLRDEQHADALVMADVIARTILAVQARAEPGETALELNADIHSVVHQAAGMVSVQLDMSVGDALVRLRAYAFGMDQSITEAARDVVSRKLDFATLDGR
ncbi:MAG: GAF and ANTAR domain-containing protein [Acidimicrobiales bacterium]